MNDESIKYRIKITKDGPYLVSGNVPLSEKYILPKGRQYEFKEGRRLPQNESYALCRCGKSKNAPFCDGTHVKTGFRGEETASRSKYHERVTLMEGPELDLLDDGRCAFARFCHRNGGSAWELTKDSGEGNNREEAIQAACGCPSGRLTAADKDGNAYEPVLEPSIDIMQDPEKGVSAGIFVKGYIPIESADGTMYEPRNRVVLCRCGKSKNKPFCDAEHMVINYFDHSDK